MTLEEFKERARIAQITRDLYAYIIAVEDYCRANEVDVWQITRRLVEVIEKEKTIDHVETLLDLAGVETLDDLEVFIATSEPSADLIEDLNSIKDDVRILYKKVIDLTSTLSQRQDT